MPNTFPTASTTIRALARIGVTAVPAHRFSNCPGLYVDNGLLCTFGPSITVRVDADRTSGAHAAEAARLRAQLRACGWSIEPAQHDFDTVIRVNSVR